jgi:hypothetical protein
LHVVVFSGIGCLEAKELKIKFEFDSDEQWKSFFEPIATPAQVQGQKQSNPYNYLVSISVALKGLVHVTSIFSVSFLFREK